MQRIDSLERLWCWEGLGAGGEGNDIGWDAWMASLTQRAWVWVNSRSWCWTGRPGVLQSMGLQRAGHDWVTELNWKCSLHIIQSFIYRRFICFFYTFHSSHCIHAFFNPWAYIIFANVLTTLPNSISSFLSLSLSSDCRLTIIDILLLLHIPSSLVNARDFEFYV